VELSGEEAEWKIAEDERQVINEDPQTKAFIADMYR
jgi:hypothetical protein